MKSKASDKGEKVILELKYCERCGGLWLRPVGGGQIYCVKCSSAIAELPLASRQRVKGKFGQGAQLGDGDELESYEDGATVGRDAGGMA